MAIPLTREPYLHEKCARLFPNVGFPHAVKGIDYIWRTGFLWQTERFMWAIGSVGDECNAAVASALVSFDALAVIGEAAFRPSTRR